MVEAPLECQRGELGQKVLAQGAADAPVRELDHLGAAGRPAGRAAGAAAATAATAARDEDVGVEDGAALDRMLLYAHDLPAQFGAAGAVAAAAWSEAGGGRQVATVDKNGFLVVWEPK